MTHDVEMSLASTWQHQVAAHYGLLSTDISRCKQVTIKCLLREKTAFRSAVRPAGKSTVPSLRDVAGLPERCCVLIGWVRCGARAAARPAIPGALYLEDQEAAVPVLFSSAGPAPYDQQVACLSWNLIVDRLGCVHVEVDEWLTLGHRAAERDVEVVTVTTARVLLDNRKQLGVNTVSICGCVDAVSEVVRIKGEPLFLVKLKDNESNVKVNLLVKGSAFLFWSSILSPHQKVVFTHLKPTSVYKGSSHEQLLFSPWKSSELLASTQCNLTVLSLQQWLSGNNATAVEVSQLTAGTAEEEESEASYKLYTVKAVITDTKEAHRGIYEIDGKARLCLSYVPACHEYRSLRVGTHITIYNAHLRGHPQPPKTRLCCCMLGCVRVDHFSRLNTKVRPYQSSQCVESHLLTRYGLTWKAWEWLISTVHSLQGKLRSYCSGADAVRLLYSLLTSSSGPPAEPLLKDNVRNLVLEFLQHEGPGGCSVIAGQGQPSVVLPYIAELLDHLQKQEGVLLRVDSDHRASTVAGGTSQGPGQVVWRYQLEGEVTEDKQLYIGWLSVSSCTGQLQLRDATGALDCVLAAPSGGDLHSCGETCHSQLRPWGQGHRASSCPRMSVDHVGRLVCVQQARLVVERFAVDGGAQEQGRLQHDEDTAWQRKYMLCSLEDIICIKDLISMKSAARKAKSLLVPHKCLSDNNNLLDKGDTAASHSRKRKLPPGATTISSRTDDAVRTCCGSCAIQSLLVVHKDALSLRSRVNQPWLSSYIQVCFLGQPVLRSHDLCSQLGDTHSKSEQLAALVDTALSESSHLVVLSLQQDAIRWFPLLHIGGIYVLTQHCCDSLVAFQRTAAQRQLHRVLEEAQTKHILTLSRDMDLRPVCVKGQLSHTRLAVVRHGLMEEGHLSDLLSVDEVLSLGSSALASFHGIVVAKHFEDAPPANQNPCTVKQQQEQNRSLGVSVPDDCSMRLTVRSTSTTEALSVYVTTRNLSYPLGLLPGAHVAIYRGQLKLSRVGRVYASCGLAGYVTVLKHPASKLEAEDMVSDGKMSSKSGEQDFTDAPQQYLCSPPEGCSTFTVSCHIQSVRKLELQATCARCGAGVQRNMCGSMACGSTQAPVCKGQVRVLVDDGSGNALVYIDSINQLQTLLALSDIQWTDLELAIAQHGPVTYNQGTAQDCCCPLCQLLKLLCESPLVQREVIMAVRRSRSAATNIAGWTLKSVDVGAVEIETYYPPLLILQCVTLKALDCRQKINQLLQEDTS